MADEDDLTSRIIVDASGAQSGSAQAVAAFQQMQAAQTALTASTVAASAANDAFMAAMGRAAVVATGVSQRLGDGARSLVGLAPSVVSGIRTINTALDEQVVASAKADAALASAVGSVKALSAAQAGIADLQVGVGPLATQLGMMEAQRAVTQGYAKDVQRVAEMYALEARAIEETRATELAKAEIRKEAQQIYASATADMMASEARTAAARRASADLMIPPIPANAKVWVTMGQDAEAAFAKGTAAAGIMRKEVEATSTSGAGLSNWLRSVITLFDEFMRGQRGAEAATIGRVIKTGGGGGILAGIGTVAAIGGVEKLTSTMAELVEKTDTAAAAVGMSVEKFSMLQRTMQIVTGSSESFTHAIATLGRQVEAALADPMGKAANEFNKFGISQEQLAAGLKDPETLLDLMRQRFQALAPDLQRTAIVSMSAGRGFQELIPYLKLANDHLAEVKSKVPLGSIITKDTVERLAPAAESTHALSEAMSGLGLTIAQTTASTQFNDWLRGIIDSLTALIPKLDEFLKQTNNLRDLSRVGLAGGAAGTAAGGIAGFMVGGPLGGLAGAGLGAYAGYKAGKELSDAMTGGASAAIPPSRFSVAPGADVTHSADQAALAQAMREAAEQLPPGYSVQATSGFRPGSTVAGTGGTSQHALAEAIDTKITGPGGAVFPSMGADPTGIYKEYGDLVLKRLQANSPELASKFASGTQFAKADAGHYDLGGARGARGPMTASPVPALPSGYDFQTTVLNAPQPGAAAIEKEFQANLKLVEDKKKLLDANSANEVAAADKDAKAVEAIKQRTLKSTQAILAQEQALRSTYAARILQTTDVNAKEEAAKVQDATNMKVKAVAAGTQLIESQNVVARQAIQDQISGLEVEKLKAKTFQEQYNIELKIADLRAKLNRDAAGELDRARALNALERERVDQQISQANFIERSMALAYQNLQLRERIATQRGGRGSSESGSYVAATDELNFLRQASQVEISHYREIANSAQSSEKVREGMYEKISEVAQKTANEELAVAQHVDARMKQSALEVARPFTSMFDSVGDASEKFFNDTVSGANRGKNAVLELERAIGGDLLKSIERVASQWAAKGLGSLIGIEPTKGGGIGDVLGQFAGKGATSLFGGSSSQNSGDNALQTAAADAANQLKVAMEAQQKLNELMGLSSDAITIHTAAATTATGAQTLHTTAVTTNAASFTADSTAVDANAATQGAGGVGSAAGGTGGLFGLFKGIGSIFGFEKGGIVSAAGGFMVPSGGLGGTPAILHPNEMVLPSNISKGMQDLIAGGGASAPNSIGISINALDSQSVKQLFMSQGSALVAAINRATRNGSPLRSY